MSLLQSFGDDSSRTTNTLWSLERQVSPKPESTIRVIGAARKLFVQRGYNNTSLAHIARAVGTSESGVLRVCGSKVMLLQMVFGLCWLERNAAQGAVAEAAAQVNPAPRFVAVAIIKGSLESYETERPQRDFMLSHFPAFETRIEPLDEERDPYVASLFCQYGLFAKHIDDLARAIVENDSELSIIGITAAALREYLISVPYGVQTSWYMYDRDQSSSLSRVTIQAVTDALIILLYGRLDVETRNAINSDLERVSRAG